MKNRKWIGGASLWFLALQAVMFFLTLIGISCYFCGAEGILDGIAILNLILFFVGGYVLSRKLKSVRIHLILILSLIWSVVLAVCIYFTRDLIGGLTWPYIVIAQTLFPAHFSGPQSEFVLNTLRPLLTAFSYVLVMAVFGIGMCVGKIVLLCERSSE